jgi:hypothetical protein
MSKPSILWDDTNMNKATFYLRVNGLAATMLRTKKQCLQMAEVGHNDRPDAIVELVRFDPVAHTDTVISRLYN